MRLNVVCWLEICVWVRLVVSSTKNKHWTYWMFLKFLHEFLRVYIFLFWFQEKFCASIFQSFLLKICLITSQCSKEYKIITIFIKRASNTFKRYVILNILQWIELTGQFRSKWSHLHAHNQCDLHYKYSHDSDSYTEWQVPTNKWK